MRILDLFKGQKLFKPGPIELDASEIGVWHERLAAHVGLDKDFDGFKRKVAETVTEALSSLRSFTDEEALAAIPDRARTMNALHGKEYAAQVQKLLKAATFTDLFSFEREQDAFLEVNSAMKDQTAKNVAVLKEFMHDELKETQSHLQELEDAVIGVSKSLEEKRYPDIRKVRDLAMRLTQHQDRIGKYENLLKSLEEDTKRTHEKRTKIESEIQEQVSLVRNAGALASLEKVKVVEEQLHTLTTQYIVVCQDALALYKKHPELPLKPTTKHVLEEIPKGALSFIPANASDIKTLFEEIVSHLEDERPGNVRSLIERLTRLAASVEQDARTIQTQLPDQRVHKREILKDVAALNVYDKRQFLLRAQAEEEVLQRKIAFLQGELDPNKRVLMERELKDLVRGLGATIKDAPEPPAEPAEA